MKTTYLIAAGLLGVSLSFVTPPAHAEVKLGQLLCDVRGGMGFVFGSSKELNCVYTPADARHRQETYSGTIKKYGLDIGSTNKTTVLWNVVSAADKSNAAGQLTGEYSGVSAEAALVAGLGANVLVGGTLRSTTLQPVSVSASQGTNLAIGLAQIELTVSTPKTTQIRTQKVGPASRRDQNIRVTKDE